jgi:riboflavin kinase/FMN adenylyltransferase
VVVDGIVYKSMTNVGVKPTISSDNIPVAETHIVGYSGDLYDHEVRVSLRDYIRPEKRFNSLEELKLAISNDISICVG